VSDFGRIYDLVESVLPTGAARSTYEWRYLANPNGKARCWVVVERSGGELVGSSSRFPWPIFHGSERQAGWFGGDLVTLPRLQRQGIFRLITDARDSHPWEGDNIVLGAPNRISRAAVASMGHSYNTLGPFPRATLLLDYASQLRSRSWPKTPARILGGAANKALALWQTMNLSRPGNVRVEEITRFDSGIDALTYETMSSPHYWCYHDAAFLNWRYLQHPGNSCVAQVAIVDDGIVGYSVVRLEGEHSTLMELVVLPFPEPVADALLHGIIGIAREAGCLTLGFYATRNWRFWGALRGAGFLPRKSEVYRTVRCRNREDVSEEGYWQILPGDSDVG